MKLTSLRQAKQLMTSHSLPTRTTNVPSIFTGMLNTIGTSNGQVLGWSLTMSFRYVGLPQNLILKSTC